MEHKDYKLEIIEKLLQNKNHIRSLAKELRTNHMIIQRKIKELEKENVVDFKEEGKNKVYSLKKNIEAKTYAFKTEGYKLLKLLEKNPKLRGIIERIQKDNRIKMAVLFGSYAKGIAKPESDIDIYINTQDEKIKRDIHVISTMINVKIGRYDKSSLLIKEIEKNHVIIKGVEEYYEKNKFFE
jgi:predicted nucleotidyltransferase